MKNFQRRLINVVNPLTNGNMVTTAMTADKATKIAQVGVDVEDRER
jgi:hypothetical protein